MRAYILLIMTLVTLISNAQIKGRIINSITKKPIPYVNIWVENESKGTTCDENGLFVLDENFKSKIIIFSAIGYETTRLKWDSISDVIVLNSEDYLLDEIVINSKKKTLENIVGKFKRSKINKFFGCGEKPKIWARYFPYSQEYNKTPYLKKIKVFSISRNKNTRFNIRVYAIDSLGKPGKYLNNKNIIGIAKKGNKITEIDVSEFDIEIPKTGLFIAFEWLIIESNKYESTYKEKGTKNKLIEIAYDPVFGTIAEETDKNSWVYTEGFWKKVPEDIFEDLKSKEKKRYSLLAIELTLSN